MTDTDERAYRGTLLCGLVGITYRQLDYWARTDLLRPSISEAHGTGSQRLYSFEDVVRLNLLKMLLDNGLSLQSCRRALDVFRSFVSDGFDGYDSLFIASDEIMVGNLVALIDELKDRPSVLKVVNLQQLVHRTQEMLVGYPVRESA